MKNIEKKFPGWYVEPLDKGWSSDVKYLLKRHGEIRTLRISTLKSLEEQRREYQHISSLTLTEGIIKPLDYGLLEDSRTYILYEYAEGEDVRPQLATLPKEEQYDLGLQAGLILSKIHSVGPAAPDTVDQEESYNRKISRKIEKYHQHQVQFPGLTDAVDYISTHRHLLSDRPRALLHGDFHIGNMIVRQGKLTVVDFNRYGFGDPYEEFDRMTMNIHYSSAFSKGLLHGYFQGSPPREFFEITKLYALTNAVGSIPWALENSPDSLSFVETMVADTLRHYADESTSVPAWYEHVMMESF